MTAYAMFLVVSGSIMFTFPEIPFHGFALELRSQDDFWTIEGASRDAFVRPKEVQPTPQMGEKPHPTPNGHRSFVYKMDNASLDSIPCFSVVLGRSDSADASANEARLKPTSCALHAMSHLDEEGLEQRCNRRAEAILPMN